MMKYAFILSAGLIAANIQPAEALRYDGPLINTAATMPLCKEHEVYSYNPYGTNLADGVSFKECETGLVFTASCHDVNALYQNIRYLDNEFAVATSREMALALRERCPALFAFPRQEFRLGGGGASR